MKKVSTKDVLKKTMGFVGEDKFTDATKLLQKVVTGKIKNKIDATKKKLYPQKFSK